jgi:tetratricopeptide (TPR) repeat protein
MLRRPLAALAIIAVLLGLMVSGGIWGSAVVGAYVTARETEEEAAAAYTQGRSLMAQKPSLNDAYEAFAKSHKLSPDGRTLACMSYCKARMDQHKEAIELANAAIKSGFRSAELYNNRGYSRMMIMMNTFTRPQTREQASNAFSVAEEDFEEALRIDPSCHAARCNRITLVIRRAMLDSSWPIPEERLTELRPPLQGPVSARLAINAARLYGLAIRNGKLRKDLEGELLEGGLNHVRLAVELGHDPQALTREPLIAPMKQDERFQNLLTTRKKDNLVTLDIDLIDPIPSDSN